MNFSCYIYVFYATLLFFHSTPFYSISVLLYSLLFYFLQSNFIHPGSKIPARLTQPVCVKASAASLSKIHTENIINYIAFYFYSTLFYSTIFYPFYSTLFYSTLILSVLFYSALLHSILFYPIVSYSPFYSILFYSCPIRISF